MKTACWMLALVLLFLCVGWAAEPPVESSLDLSEQMRNFERNVALGAALTMRPGTPEELEQLQKLADEGLEQARKAAAEQPDSAEANYLLGSWLLYGYRVAESKLITFDPRGGARTETVRTSAQGLADSPDEGLAALRRVTELAPKHGDYLLDYAAALSDCDRLDTAMGVLKSAWAGEASELQLTQEQKIEAGLLLSDISAAEGRLDQAREWIYAALSLDAAGARAVERLRRLKVAEAAATQEAIEAAVEAATAAVAEEAAGEEGAEEELYYGEEWSETEAEEEGFAGGPLAEETEPEE